VVVALTLVLALGAALATTPTLPVSEIRVGDVGYALTVERGTRIDRFEVEVLDVLQNVGMPFPLILIRASGPLIDRSGGVASGMSGSPVYIRDRLIGAIGFGFNNADHTLALVTPIEAMLRALPEQLSAQLTPHLPEGAVPVKTPLVMGGFSGRSVERMGALMRSVSDTIEILPIQTGPRTTGVTGADLAPGSAFGVMLVQGDFTVGSIGTLTYRDGDRVLGFGHPFLQRGAMDMILTPATISTIVRSQAFPFKLGSTGVEVLGTISQDRPAAVGGTVGARASMLPIELRVTYAGETRSYSFEVVRDEILTPNLTAIVLLDAFDFALERLGSGDATLRWRIELDGFEPVVIQDRISDLQDVSAFAAFLGGLPLAQLTLNQYAEPGLRTLTFDVELSDDVSLAEATEAIPDRERIRAGESMAVAVRIQPYRRSAEVKTLLVPIPGDVGPGLFTFTVRGGGAAPRQVGDDENGGVISQFRSFGELVSALRDRVRTDELVAEYFDETGRRNVIARLEVPFVLIGRHTVEVFVIDSESPPAAPGRPGRVEPDREAPQPPPPDR
jgi:hypothetical protein